ncbi:kinase-like protein [Ramicandelaber brevisporus]|nr:kinase-like protein [Ramicandelaber brevisporus]
MTQQTRRTCPVLKDDSELLDRYIPLVKIGQGQYGRVFKAQVRGVGAVVALKLVDRSQKTPEEVAAYRLEAALLRRLRHPNLVRQVAYFETPERLCIVTELCECDLAAYLRIQRFMSEPEVRAVGQQLVSALHYLHDRGVIHHDIKPHNVLISSDGRIRLCDLGLATILRRRAPTFQTLLKGTPLYLAPEIFEQQPYTYQCDFWSLGVVLYELFVGQVPWRAKDFVTLAHHIKTKPITWPREISPELKDLVAKLLTRPLDERMTWIELRIHPFFGPQPRTTSSARSKHSAEY